MLSNTTPFYADPQNIADSVSDKTYRLGLHYFNNNCVLECDVFPAQIVATVEADDSDLPHLVKIDINEITGEATSMSCYCEEVEEIFCCHAVAVLLHCSDQLEAENEQKTTYQLQDTALLDRIKKGQKEVNVEAVNAANGYGEWQASSIASATHRNTFYKVNIRSLTERQNTCTCPDWRNNQLGTCKHVEAVLHDIRRKNNNQLPALPMAKPFVYRGWEGRQAILKLQRTANMPLELSKVLDAFFDQIGYFNKQLPEGFYELQTQLYDNSYIEIGNDAIEHVRAIQQRQNHALRKREIQEHIQLNGERIAGVNAKLFPYQVEGVAFLASNGRALLADDMGLGKTLQAITAAFWLHRHANLQKVLIICPASLKSQWAREIEKFTGMESQVIQGNPEKRRQQYRNNKLFVIINYETTIPDLETINTVVAPDLIVIDEAQRLKNWRTKIASSVKLISSKYVFVLTGTPLENKLEELYSVMQIVDPAYLGPLWRFMADFHITDENGKVLAYRNLSELRKTIEPVMLRRNRSIVSQQLPPMTKIRVDVPMTNVQMGLHDDAISAAGHYANIAKNRPLTPTESHRLMAALQQARMACDAAGLVDKESKGAPKLEELRRFFTEICIDTGEKVVVFSCWKLMTSMIEELAREMKLGHVHLHGGVPSEKRGELMKAFHEDDSISVFIATDAGSTGLNLQCATTLINVDVPWTPAVIEQRNARIHRLGQRSNVRIISLISHNSYEERVLALVNSKQDLFNSTIIGDSENDVITVGGKGLSSLINDLQTQEKPEKASPEQSTDNLEDEAGLRGEYQHCTITESVDIPATQQQESEMADVAVKSQWLSEELSSDSLLVEILGAVEKQFAKRIDSVKAQPNQIILVLDEITDSDEAFTDQLNSDIPIVLLDPRSMRQLQKLSPNGWQSFSDNLAHATNSQPQKQTSPWHKIASDKYLAAKILNQQSISGALDLLSAAVCAKISAIAHKDELISVDKASLELYTNAEILEKLTSEEIGNFIKVFNLSRLNTPIPDALIDTLLTELESSFAIS